MKPCGHSGCLSHFTHPCEGCGRIQGYEFSEDVHYAAEKASYLMRCKAIQALIDAAAANPYAAATNELRHRLHKICHDAKFQNSLSHLTDTFVLNGLLDDLGKLVDQFPEKRLQSGDQVGIISPAKGI